MKKRLLSLLLATSCICGLVACKDTEKQEKDETTQVSEKKEDEENDETTEESSEVKGQEYIVYSYVDSDKIYVVDDDGQKVENIFVNKYKSYLSKAGYDPENASVSCVNGDILLIDYDDYANDVYEVLALDSKTGEVTSIDINMDEVSLVSKCSYNGLIYIHDFDYDKNVYTERAYEKDADSLTFKEVEDEALELKDYDLLSNKDGRPVIVNRLVDDYGFALVSIYSDGKRTGIGKCTQDGKVEKVEGFKKNNFSAECYDKDYFVYGVFDEESYSTTGYEVYNLSTGETKKIDIPVEYSIIGLKDGILYYQQGPDHYASKNSDFKLYGYNLESDSSELISTVKSVPGVGELSTYTQLVGNTILLAKMEGPELRIYKVDNKNSLKDIDCPIKTYSAYKYGSVISDCNQVKCVYCDAILYKTYGEAFVLDSKYSPYAEQINAALKEKLDSAMAYTPEVNSDECEYHQDESYCETDDESVSDVRIINDQYLIIDMDSYWYGGGAHGMPGMWEYIFDLTTGEELTFADFYSGTEEEFKNLVATKVKEDYERQSAGGNSPYYFAESAEEIYDTAYEYTHLDSPNIIFLEDKVICYFYPYDLASYADGFQYFEFTYEEILGTNTLTR